MNRTLVLALGLLLAIPPSAADPATAFTATSVRAVGPDPGELRGDLVALVLEDTTATGSAGPAPPFSVEAKDMHLTVVHSDGALRVHTVAFRPPPSTNETDHWGATLEETASRPGYELHIQPARDYPRPTVTVTQGCFDIGSTEHANVTRLSHVTTSDHQTTIEVDLRQAAMVTDCGNAVVTVTGAFAIHLWQVDMLLREEGRTRTVQSGQIRSPAMAGMPADAGRDQEVYIVVRDGTLRMPFTDEARLYLRGIDGQLDGMVVLDNAHGRLETGARSILVDDQTVELRGGPIHITVIGHGTDPLQVTMDNGWREADLGDEVVAAEPAGLRSASAAPAAIVVVALAALALRRRGAA